RRPIALSTRLARHLHSHRPRQPRANRSHKTSPRSAARCRLGICVRERRRSATSQTFTVPDRLQRSAPGPDLPGRTKPGRQSEPYAYEIVNFVDGKRTVGEIRNAVSAEYGPLPLALVVDYLEACAEAKVIQWK